MFSSVCQFTGSVSVSAHPHSSATGVRPVDRHLHPHSGTYGLSVGGALSPVVGMSSTSSTAAAMLHHHNHHQHSSCASSTSSTLLEHQKECTLCWPSHTYAKSRTIRLRRKDNNTSLGFSIRGGWEHGIGFYVSEVQQSSLAAKKGLCPGDQILQINGFPLERVVHEEVVALIRMSSNDLILRVRSAGIVPHKDHPGEVLTWKRLMHQHQTARLANGNAPAGGGTINSAVGGGGGGHCTASASSEVSSFVYTRPRSAASDSFTPSSASSSSEEGHSPHHLCDHHLHPSSSEESSTSELTSTSPLLGQYGSSATVSSYNEKQLYIRCHQPGSSLGCSVVNGPLTCPGIFVQNVKEGKLAAKCGLEIGDQIVKVNNVDVSAIGFDGAITLLKSLTELSLLVRKGVGRHIFECRDQYHIFDARKECHFSSEQSSSHAFSTNSKASLIKSPSESTLYYPASSSSSATLNPARSYAAYYHHHQYKTIQTAPLLKPCNVATGSTNVSLDGPGAHFCASAAYSTVQISSNGSTIANGGSTCDKSRCCCKRQRTVTATTTAPEASGQLLYETCGAPVGSPLIASTCSSCTLVMQSNAALHPDATHHHHHSHHGGPGGGHHASGLSVGPPPPPPSSLFTADSARLDQVTSAMANSIRILREVREKEEKLVEASRMLNEEHQKLCREKEKLKLFEMDKNPSEHRKESNASTSSTIPTPPALMDGWSAVNSPYSTLSTVPLRGSTLASSSVPGTNSSKLRANSHSTVGPTFSFLEEVKALGESGIKRHLKPVNSNGDTLGSRGSGGGGSAGQSNGSPDTMNSDAKNKLLRRLPFANAGGSSKEAETKQRQHELLMEEFRIAHQRMFGGKENNGTLLGKIRARAAALEEESEQPGQQQQLSPKLEASKAQSCIPEPPPPMREAPMQMTKVVSSGTNRSHTKEHYHHQQHPPPPPTASRMREKAVLPQHREIYESTGNLSATATDRTTMANLANAANRITIKVLSPKIGS